MPAGRAEPVYAPYVEHVPPDVTAGIFWSVYLAVECPWLKAVAIRSRGTSSERQYQFIGNPTATAPMLIGKKAPTDIARA
jgi:hypothetical protein